MQLNKILQERSPRDRHPHTPSCKPNNLEFSYLKRKPQPRKPPIPFSALDSYHIQLNNSARHTLNLQRLQTETPEKHPLCLPASHSMPAKQKIHRKQLVMHTDEPELMEYIRSPFPQRKKKSNEYQLFKMLSKYSEHKPNYRFLTEPSHSTDQPLHPLDRPAHSGIKPHLKSRPKLKWDKLKYCANRDREGGVLPSSLALAPRLQSPTQRTKPNQQTNRPDKLVHL